MSGEPVLRLEACTKVLFDDFNAGRRQAFARLWRPNRPMPGGAERRARRVLDGITLRIEAGEKVNIAGPPGSGKTLLAELMAGVLTPTSGAIHRAMRAGYFAGLPGFVPRLMTPREYVGFAIHLGGHGGEIGPYDTGELLALSGLDAHRGRYLRDVARERLVALQLELFRRTRVRTLLLDEPAPAILDTLAARLDFAQLTIVALSRRPIPAFERFDRLAVLANGRFTHDGGWAQGLACHAEATRGAPSPAAAGDGADDADDEDESGMGY